MEVSILDAVAKILAARLFNVRIMNVESWFSAVQRSNSAPWARPFHTARSVCRVCPHTFADGLYSSRRVRQTGVLAALRKWDGTRLRPAPRFRRHFGIIGFQASRRHDRPPQ